MKTKTEFTPIFLYRDEERIASQNQMHKEWLASIQKGLDAASDLFDENLTDEELTRIMNGGWDAVGDLMREKSNFPNAKIETLFDLYGKDKDQVKLAKMALNYVVNRSQAIKASISSGIVIISESFKKESEEQLTYYTNSIRQNEILKDAKELSELMNRLLDKNIIDNIDLYQTCSRLKIVESKKAGNGEFEVVPSLRGILRV